mgnify:CR=1 FL=1
MSEQIIKNNVAELIGIVRTGFTFSHEIYGESFYSFTMEVARLSNSSDMIPMLVSERLMDISESMEGKLIAVQGQFRSYNKHTGGRSRLLLSVFVREWAPAEPDDPRNPNNIFLDGYICKKPVYRTTPLGREITDLLIAVNRPYNKSDYIPAIAWGRNAKYAETMEVGQNIRIYGRIQSRNYQKKLSEDKTDVKTAYEVSISKMEVEKLQEASGE